MADLFSDEILYDALLRRDTRFDGRAWVGVRTTGILCRLSCPARKPRRENAAFFGTIAAGLAAGYRPCKRCRPLASAGAPDPLVARLLSALDAEPGRRWSEADVARLGIDPSTARRAFRRAFGTTFLSVARATRLRGGAALRSAGASVIDAQLEAGFESGSGFRAAFARLLGVAPGSLSGDESLRADWIDTPLGPMVAVADETALRLLEFADRRALPTELRAVQVETRCPIGLGRFAPTDRIESELRAYFGNGLRAFETPTAPYGSAFAKTVWDALRGIPPARPRATAPSPRRSAVRARREPSREPTAPTVSRSWSRATASSQRTARSPVTAAADGGRRGFYSTSGK